MNLTSFGTGLTGFMEGYQKQRQQQMERALQELALQKYKQQQSDYGFLGSLPGSVFGQGDPNMPALRPAGGLGLPGATPQMPPQGPSPMMQPQAPPQAARPPQPPMLPPAAAAGPTELTPEMQDKLADMPRLDPQGNADLYRALGADPGAGAPPAKPAAAPAAAAAAGIPTEAEPAAPAATTPTGSAPAAATLPPEVAGKQFTDPVAGAIFGHKNLTLGDLMDRMRAAKPDADPAQVARAAMLTYDLVEKGNAAEQNFAWKALTQLRLYDQLGETARHHTATETQGDKRIETGSRNADTAAARAGETARHHTATETAATGKASEQKRQFETRMTETRGLRDRGEKMRRLTAELSSLDRQMGQLRATYGSSPSKEQKAELAGLGEQRQQVIAEMNKPAAAGAPARP